jgi:ankyrin repeat protein
MDVNIRNNALQTPLHAACEENHLPIVQLLVQLGANLNVYDENNASPLVIACTYCHNDIVRFLLSNNAEYHTVSQRVLGQNRDMTTGHNTEEINETISILKEYHWFPRLDYRRYCQTNDIAGLIEFCQLWFPSDESPHFHELYCELGDHGANALMIASLHGSVDVVKYLTSPPLLFDVEVSSQWYRKLYTMIQYIS